MFKLLSGKFEHRYNTADARCRLGSLSSQSVLPPFRERVDLISTFCGLSPPIDSHLLEEPSLAD